VQEARPAARWLKHSSSFFSCPAGRVQGRGLPLWSSRRRVAALFYPSRCLPSPTLRLPPRPISLPFLPFSRWMPAQSAFLVPPTARLSDPEPPLFQALAVLSASAARTSASPSLPPVLIPPFYLTSMTSKHNSRRSTRRQHAPRGYVLTIDFGTYRSTSPVWPAAAVLSI
jgi:hypothetical protein